MSLITSIETVPIVEFKLDSIYYADLALDRCFTFTWSNAFGTGHYLLQEIFYKALA